MKIKYTKEQLNWIQKISCLFDRHEFVEKSKMHEAISGLGWTSCRKHCGKEKPK